MKSKNLNLLVISDLHAIIDLADSDESHLIFNGGVSRYGDALISYIKGFDFTLDVLICAGDIGNKGILANFEMGWSFVNKLKDETGIKELLCVPGNHDHKSRNNDPDVFCPKHNLQFTKPIFPSECKIKNTNFWAWNWCVGSSTNYNSILINSSAYHGYGEELDYGRVALEVTDQIIEHVNSDAFVIKPINILVCHHHPIKMEGVDMDYDQEVIQGSEYLIAELNGLDKGAWLIIHGHKHFPRINYAASTSSIPITVFSAGSMSAKLHSAIDSKTKNQCYVIDINLDESERNGRAVGTFYAHEWTLKDGWRASSSNDLPKRGGFGFAGSPVNIAHEITELISEENPFLEEADLKAFSKTLEYFTPSDFKNLVKTIERKGFLVDCNGLNIVQVGRKNE